MSKHLAKLQAAFTIFLFASSFFVFLPAQAADTTYCFCHDDLNRIQSDNYTKMKGFEDNVLCEDKSKVSTVDCNSLKEDTNVAGFEVPSITCQEVPNATSCYDARDLWTKQVTARLQSAKATVQGSGSILGHIPDCVMADVLTPECRDVGVFIELFINWARGSFAMLGTFALVFFIYGGMNLILSQGNPEKIKKGTDAMMAALIGLFICFVAYLAIQYLGEAIQIKPQFRLQ